MKRRVWSNEDVEYIMVNYATTPNVDIAEHLGLDAKVVAKKTFDLGLKKTVRIYKNNWASKTPAVEPASQTPKSQPKQDVSAESSSIAATTTTGVLPSNEFKMVRQYVLVAMHGLVNGQLSSKSARLSLDMARFIVESGDVELAHQEKAQVLFNAFVKMDEPAPIAEPKQIIQPTPTKVADVHPWRELDKQSSKTPSAIERLVNVPTSVEPPNIGVAHQHFIKA
ncbi:hypothetical protein DTO96_102164 [Ephemeroptericola cinctiostellae]|uniref:Uncharacterized protein n=1 Tax=Ephemeroptericola cinctiostellae TaxID=2268024 RepID=A0A345DDH2_9BURK|nr:hypothetical protein [Ephemeroptericola cinctiostellae]AXF86410.1 hypothetical protein DTO96_102164 [Ephemeroptericola cinctiostellae]